ncbi:MAG: hypothetical protein Q9202_003903 [Teloschistes flavicans]
MLTPQQCPVTPTKKTHSAIGPAPKLKLDIPSLSLRDAQDDSDDVPKSPVAPAGPSLFDSKLPILVSTLHSEPIQLWPSPHVHLTGELPVKAAYAAMEMPALVTDNHESQACAEEHIPSTSADTNRRDELVPAASRRDSRFPEASDAKSLRSSEDTFYTADSGSNTRTSSPTASTARTSVSGLPLSMEVPCLATSTKPSKDFKGTYFKGMVVPIAKATHSSKRTLTSIGVQSISRGSSVGELEFLADSEIAEPRSTSCASHITGQGAGRFFQTEATHMTAEVSSDGNPAEISSHIPGANMGPREIWDEARANREQRYNALQSMSSYSDASTDECSNFGSELEMTPNLFRVPKVEQEANHSEDSSPRIRSIFRRKNKSTSPLKFRRKHKSLAKEPERPSDLDHGEVTAMSRPHHMSNRPEPIQLNIEEYMGDKQLRLELLEADADILLYEPSNANNASTAPDSIFITSALDPNDELDRRRINPSYLRRAHMTRAELKANPISDDEDSDSPASTLDESMNESSEGMEGESSSVDLPAWAEILPDNALSTSTINIDLDFTDVDSWKSSDDNARGRSSTRSPPSTAGQRSTKGPAEAPKSTRRDYSPTRRQFAKDSPTSSGRHFSPSRSTDVTPETILQEHQYLERHYERVKEEEVNASPHAAQDDSSAPRQRLADISMVERRQMLSRQAEYEHLCKIVYDCEKMSREAERLAAEDDSAAEGSVEEEDGYSAATFDGGLSHRFAPPA